MSEPFGIDESTLTAEAMVDAMMRPLARVFELLAEHLDDLAKSVESQRVEHERLVAELRDDLLETAGKVATLERLVMKPTEGRW